MVPSVASVQYSKVPEPSEQFSTVPKLCVQYSTVPEPSVQYSTVSEPSVHYSTVPVGAGLPAGKEVHSPSPGETGSGLVAYRRSAPSVSPLCCICTSTSQIFVKPLLCICHPQENKLRPPSTAQDIHKTEIHQHSGRPHGKKHKMSFCVTLSLFHVAHTHDRLV